MNMEAAGSSSTFVTLCQLTWRHMPEDWSVKYDSGFGGSDATSLVNGFRTFPMT